MQALVYRALPVDTGDFRLLSRNCLEALKSMRETHRFLRGMVAWVGFPQCAVKYRRLPRAGGATKYPLRKMLAFAWTAATSFSTIPLQLTLILGLLVGLLGAEEAVRAVVESARGQVVPGWTSLMVVTSVIGSAMLIGLGIVGQYIARIYEETKDRPLYVIAQTYSSREPEQEATSR
jgi:dolichol-phosphate mannosyltransferase